MSFRSLEINGGRVAFGRPWTFLLPPVEAGYADAQIGDYAGLSRRQYRWRPGTSLTLQARFSHGGGRLVGTAGFGFWNAPYGDPSVRWPALPQAVWFFYASHPSDLPFAAEGQGRGWFASTIDAGRPRAWLLAPLAPVALLLHQSQALRRRIWPWIRRQLSISFSELGTSMTDWHDYRLAWQSHGCEFWVDGRQVATTQFAPRGPLGFVCWLDNQYLVATPTGRFKWGVLPTTESQWMEVKGLSMSAE